MTRQVTSPDGTPIAYEVTGSGPPLIIVSGGLEDGSEHVALADALADAFMVVTYARRGRGRSGDTLPYALGREIADLDSLAHAVGQPAHVYGISSGGALALEAAAAGCSIDRLAVYEVPYPTDERIAARWRSYVERLRQALAEGRRDEAIDVFMRVIGSSEDAVAAAHRTREWATLRDLAPTLAYDAACLGDGPPPVDRLSRITRPTLVVTGGADRSVPAGEADAGVGREMSRLAEREVGHEYFARAGDAIAAAIPDSTRVVLSGQGPMADPAAVAPLLTRFFLD